MFDTEPTIPDDMRDQICFKKDCKHFNMALKYYCKQCNRPFHHICGSGDGYWDCGCSNRPDSPHKPIFYPIEDEGKS